MKYLFVTLSLIASIQSAHAVDCTETAHDLVAKLYLEGFHTIQPQKSEGSLTVYAQSDHEIIHPYATVQNAGLYQRSYTYSKDSKKPDQCHFSTLKIQFRKSPATVLDKKKCTELKEQYKLARKESYKLWHPFRRVKKTHDEASKYGRACDLAFTTPTFDDYYQE